MIPTQAYVLLSLAMLSLGILGILTQKSALRLLISVELILNAANVNFVAFANHYGNADGYVFTLFVIALAAAEAAVGLAFMEGVMGLFQRAPIPKWLQAAGAGDEPAAIGIAFIRPAGRAFGALLGHAGNE